MEGAHSIWIELVALIDKCRHSYPTMHAQLNNVKTAETLFRQRSGMLRAAEAVALGIHPRTLYQMRDEQRLIAISRGLYRLSDMQELTAPDLVTVATRVPKAWSV
jgi:hypothetical protein